MVDIFERLEKNAGGPIGMYMGYAHGYFAFPKLEGRNRSPHDLSGTEDAELEPEQLPGPG